MKRFRVLSVCFAALLWNSSIAQERVLFTVDGREEVTAEEFKAVYNKNRDIGEQIDPKTPEEYLQLYIDFKLKVLEAKDSAMDMRQSFLEEFHGYRSQLAKPYLTDKGSEEALVEEAYKRMQTDVAASHIMISVADFNNPKDTAAAYGQLQSVREQLTSGEMGFEEAAKLYSEDTYSAQRGGSLGYFSVFDMVYPFENQVYGLEVGGISPVFKTQFGYHIARLDATRPARGRIQVAHIMLLLPENASADQSAEVQRKIEEIHQKLSTGASSFEDMVLQFSQDKTTRNSQGRLPEFGMNDMVNTFEDAAYGLSNPGDVSKPVRTPYGWHIIKLIQKIPVPSFEEAESDLVNRIKRDQRAQVSQERFVRRLFKEYNFQVLENPLKSLAKKVKKDDFVGTSLTTNENYQDRSALATFGDQQEIMVFQFVDFIEQNPGLFPNETEKLEMLKTYMDLYAEERLLAYENTQLERKYPEFRRLVNEYRDGILLFDLTDKKIWTRSMKDTLGLQNYYEAHKGNYRWNTRYDYTIYDCENKKMAKKVLKEIKAGTSDSLILAKYNSESALNIQIESKLEETPEYAEVNSMTAGMVSKPIEKNGRFFIFQLHQVMEPRTKELKEVRGLVAADYQKELEAAWIQELRTRYPVTIDTAVKQAVFSELAD